MASVRTEEEKQNKRFNYFYIFKIPFDETNVKKIEKALQDGKKWYNGTGNANIDAVVGRRLNGLQADIDNIMLNDAVYDEATGEYIPNSGGRKKEAENGKKLCLEAIGEIITVLARRGMVLKSELRKISQNEGISLTEIENYFAKVFSGGVRYIDDLKKAIPFSAYKEIDTWLATIGKGDTLYAFFNVPNDAPYDQIKTAIDKASAGAGKNEMGVKTAITNVCGKASTLLKDKEKRDMYDAYIALKNSVFGEILALKSYKIDTITSEQYLNYVANIQRTLNCSLEHAEDLLLGALSGAPAIQVESGGTSKVDLELCPYPDCGKPYVRTSGIKVCPNCGRPFEVLCWNCQNTVPYSSKSVSCSKCGATAQLETIYRQRVAEMDKLLSSSDGDISKLKAGLLNIKNVLPGYDRFSNSVIVKKIQGYSDEVALREKTEETMGKQYRAEYEVIKGNIAEKKYFSARDALLRLRKKYPTYNADNTNSAISMAEAEIAKSQNFVQTTKKYLASSDESRAVEAAVKALSICSDNLDAIQILRAYPPKQPTNLRIVETNGKIRLEWSTNAFSDDITKYVVVRKTASPLKDENDGAVIAKDLSVSFYEDSNVSSATPYYYGVYSERYGIKSAPIISKTPISILLDINHPVQEMIADKISIKWDKISGVEEIEVWKKNGNVPIKRGDGKKLSEVTMGGFVDSTPAADGNSYFIVCAYKSEGKIVYSKGVSLNYVPFKIPKEIKDISITVDPTGRFVLTHKQDDSGTLQVYYAEEKVGLPIGKIQQREVLNGLNGKIVKLNTIDEGYGGVSFSLPQDCLLWLFVINTTSQLFVASAPLLISTVEGIKGLKYTVEGVTLKITGSFHPQLKEVVVKVSASRFAMSLKDDGMDSVYSLAQIKTNGGIIVHLKSNSLSYITIFSKVMLGDSVANCTPVSLPDVVDTRVKQSVVFTLDYNPSPIKPFMMTIKFEADAEVNVPNFILMRGRPAPRNKNTGEFVEKVNGITLKKTLFSRGKYVGFIKVKMPPIPKGAGIALFPEEDSAKVQFRELIKI